MPVPRAGRLKTMMSQRLLEGGWFLRRTRLTNRRQRDRALPGPPATRNTGSGSLRRAHRPTRRYSGQKSDLQTGLGRVPGRAGADRAAEEHAGDPGPDTSVTQRGFRRAGPDAGASERQRSEALAATTGSSSVSKPPTHAERALQFAAVDQRAELARPADQHTLVSAIREGSASRSTSSARCACAIGRVAAVLRILVRDAGDVEALARLAAGTGSAPCCDPTSTGLDVFARPCVDDVGMVVQPRGIADRRVQAGFVEDGFVA